MLKRAARFCFVFGVPVLAAPILGVVLAAGAGPAAGAEAAWQPLPAEEAEAERDRVIRLLDDGAEALARGGNEDAVEAFTKAILSGRLSPQPLALAHHHRGIAHQKLGLSGHAVADYTNALVIDALPERIRPRTLFNRAIAYDDLGDADKALADYGEAIKLKRTYAAAYNNRGNVRRRLGDFQGAIADYDAAIAFRNGLLHLPYYGRGLAHEGLGNRERALEDFTKAFDLAPEFAPAEAKLAEYGAGLPTGAITPEETVTHGVEKAANAMPPDGPTVAAGADTVPEPPPLLTETELAALASEPELDRARQTTPGGWVTTIIRYDARSSETGLSDAARTDTAPDRYDTKVVAAAPGLRLGGRTTPVPFETAVDTPAGDLPLATGAIPKAEAAPSRDDGVQERIKASAPPTRSKDRALNGSAFRVQVGSYRSPAKAEDGWETVARAHPDLTGDLQPFISEADLGTRGIYYRLQLGPLAQKTDATGLCARFKSAGTDCIIVPPKE